MHFVTVVILWVIFHVMRTNSKSCCKERTKMISVSFPKFHYMSKGREKAAQYFFGIFFVHDQGGGIVRWGRGWDKSYLSSNDQFLTKFVRNWPVSDQLRQKLTSFWPTRQKLTSFWRTRQKMTFSSESDVHLTWFWRKMPAGRARGARARARRARPAGILTKMTSFSDEILTSFSDEKCMQTRQIWKYYWRLFLTNSSGIGQFLTNSSEFRQKMTSNGRHFLTNSSEIGQKMTSFWPTSQNFVRKWRQMDVIFWPTRVTNCLLHQTAFKVEQRSFGVGPELKTPTATMVTSKGQIKGSGWELNPQDRTCCWTLRIQVDEDTEELTRPIRIILTLSPTPPPCAPPPWFPRQHQQTCYIQLVRKKIILKIFIRPMVRWMCGVKLCDRVPTTELYALLGLEEISSAVGTRRLRWYGHVRRSSGSIATVERMKVKVGNRGRPRKSWKECVSKDREDRDLLDLDPMDRPVWRSAVYASRLLYTPS